MDRWMTVNSLRFDLSVRRSWACRLIERKDNELTLIGAFDNDVDHANLGRILAGTISCEYFWLDRWYNVFRFHEPGGEFRLFYCNICLPPLITDESLSYVDLDIDVVVGPDGKAAILDTEDFERNSVCFGYPENVKRRVFETVVEVLGQIREKKFPFNTVNDCNQ